MESIVAEQLGCRKLILQRLRGYQDKLGWFLQLLRTIKKKKSVFEDCPV